MAWLSKSSCINHKLIICLAIFHLSAAAVSAQEFANDIVGVWLTGGDEPAKIQIYRSYDKFYGRIIWLQNPEKDGNPRVDKNNPDESKRNRQIVGLGILNGMKFDKDDKEWHGGKIYDPESGKTYNCQITLRTRNTLRVRGYVGWSLLGRTETWTRTD
jgi:uncharacterized protein (DUF2147 family)